MATLRSYIDNNQEYPLTTGSSVVTDIHKHAVHCGMCAKEFYVNDEDYRLYTETINSGLDNPFRCEVCIEEYDDLAYEG